MNRTDLSFLRKLFVHNDLSDYQILIINQTNSDSLLVSDSKRIRVINSFDIGISKSRNLAIKNAIGDICLIADDDVEYVKGFDDIIKEAYAGYLEAECIVFNSFVPNKKRNTKYLNYSKKIKKIQECVNVFSPEISFKRKCIQSNDLKFNELLGLNSAFEAGEELVFLNNILKEHNVFFVDRIILKHEGIRTGEKLNLMQLISVLAVQYHLIYSNMFYFFVIKLMLFLIKKKQLSFIEIPKVFTRCLQARKEYIKLVSS
jgi:glycosyltransferase involved in cell wall biosynthesis